MQPGTQGTGFVNLSQYLDANKDAIGSTANALATQDANAATAAKAADDKIGQAAYDQAKAQGPGNTFDVTSLPDYANAQQQSQNAYQALQGLAGNQITDPTTGLKTQAANSLRNQLQANGAGNANYGSGGSAFDAGLLGGSGAAQQTFKNAANGFGDLNNYLQTTANAQQQAGYGAYQPPATAPVYQAPNLNPNIATPVSPQGTGENGSGGTSVYKDYQKPLGQGFNNSKNGGAF